MARIKRLTRVKVRIESRGEGVRKPYEPPRIEKFGNIAKLTTGVTGTTFDPGHNSQTKRGSCL